MVTVRSAKIKGSQFEYDVHYSIGRSNFYTDCYLTKERGFQRQFDIELVDIQNKTTAIECKRLKGISWNQLVKFYEKLCTVASEANNHFLVFKSRIFLFVR